MTGEEEEEEGKRGAEEPKPKRFKTKQKVFTKTKPSKSPRKPKSSTNTIPNNTPLLPDTTTTTTTVELLRFWPRLLHLKHKSALKDDGQHACLKNDTDHASLSRVSVVLKAAPQDLELELLQDLESLYAFDHRQWWCYHRAGTFFWTTTARGATVSQLLEHSSKP